MSVWWQWMREALSPTPEELQRLVDPISPVHLEDAIEATEPTSAEFRRLVEPVSAEILAVCSEATSPDAIEVQRLVARVRETESTRRGALAWLRPLVLSGAGVAAVGLALTLPQTPEFVTTETQWVTVSDAVALNAAITIDGEAQVQVTQVGDQGTRVDMAEGAVWFEVDPLGAPNLRSLLVVAGDVRVRVRGTRFQVRRAAGQVSVDVARGKVHVSDGQEAVELSAGQTWSSAPVVGTTTVAQLREVTEELAERLPAPRLGPPSRDPALGPPVPNATKEVVPELRVLPETSEPVRSASSEVEDLAAREDERILVVDGSDMAKDQWAILQKRIRDGDVQVLTGLDNFLAHYGDTAYAEPAQMARLNLLIERRPPMEALSEVERWLDDHPVSPRFIDVHGLRAGLTLHQLQDCQAALPSLEIVADRGRAEEAATAYAWHGICSLELGQPEAAAESLDRALEMGVPDPLRARVKDDAREARKQLRR